MLQIKFIIPIPTLVLCCVSPRPCSAMKSDDIPVVVPITMQQSSLHSTHGTSAAMDWTHCFTIYALQLFDPTCFQRKLKSSICLASAFHWQWIIDPHLCDASCIDIYWLRLANFLDRWIEIISLLFLYLSGTIGTVHDTNDKLVVTVKVWSLLAYVLFHAVTRLSRALPCTALVIWSTRCRPASH